MTTLRGSHRSEGGCGGGVGRGIQRVRRFGRLAHEAGCGRFVWLRMGAPPNPCRTLPSGQPLFAVVGFVVLGGCTPKEVAPAVGIRPEQVFAGEMLERADRVVLGTIEWKRPLGSEYSYQDSLGRTVRVRQMLLSVAVLGVVRNRLPEEDAGRLEFLFVESLGLAAGQVIKGLDQSIALGPALVPLRRENGRWRSVVDLWRPVLPISLKAGELAGAKGTALTPLLIRAARGRGEWPVLEASAAALSQLDGPDAVIRELRGAAVGGDGFGCAVCVDLAMHFQGQYGCLAGVLRNARCGVAEKKTAAMVLQREEMEVRFTLQAIRARNVEYLRVGQLARSLPETLAVLAMHRNAQVRAAAVAWRAELER